MHNSHLNRPFQARLLQLTLLQHQLFSNLTPTNNSERSCPRSHENSQTSPHNLCPKITSLAKNPSMHPLQNSISYLYHSSNLSTLLRSPTSHHPPGSTRSSSYLSLSRPPVSSSLKFCNRSFAYAAPVLWNGLPKDLRQFAHPPNRALNFTYPPLAFSSATFHSRLT